MESDSGSEFGIRLINLSVDQVVCVADGNLTLYVASATQARIIQVAIILDIYQ